MRTVHVLVLAALLCVVAKVLLTDVTFIGDPNGLAVAFWGHGRACDVWFPSDWECKTVQVWGDTIAVVNE